MGSVSDPTRLNVIIVGAGLCGLSMAISIALVGHHVTVFEAHDGLHEFGAGVQSSPNGTRIYNHFGLAEALEPLSTKPELLQISRSDGTLLAQRKKYDQEVLRRYGLPLWTIHRVDLQTKLFQRAVDLGAEIFHGRKVLDVNSEESYIELEGGEKRRGDLVVIANGIWSNLRSTVLQKQVDPQPTGDMAYRIILDSTQVDDSEVLAWMKQPRVQIWIGPRSHAVGYTVRGDTQLNLVFLTPDDFQGQESRVKGSIEELRDSFEGWDPLLSKILGQVKKIDKWRLMHVPTLPTWRSEKGNVILGGDCCHAILPYMAQGLNMALEDAATLGALLSHVQSLHQLPKATEIYERLRRVRTGQLLAETKRHGDEFHLDDGELQERRDAALAESFEGGNDWTHPKAQPWIWSYDALDEAEKVYQSDPF